MSDEQCIAIMAAILYASEEVGGRDMEFCIAAAKDLFAAVNKKVEGSRQ